MDFSFASLWTLAILKFSALQLSRCLYDIFYLFHRYFVFLVLIVTMIMTGLFSGYSTSTWEVQRSVWFWHNGSERKKKHDIYFTKWQPNRCKCNSLFLLFFQILIKSISFKGVNHLLDHKHTLYTCIHWIFCDKTYHTKISCSYIAVFQCKLHVKVHSICSMTIHTVRV